MIKVTVKEKVYKDNLYQEIVAVKEYPRGLNANVYNGVLTIYAGGNEPNFKEAIAGHMPDVWLSWEKI